MEVTRIPPLKCPQCGSSKVHKVQKSIMCEECKKITTAQGNVREMQRSHQDFELGLSELQAIVKADERRAKGRTHKNSTSLDKIFKDET